METPQVAPSEPPAEEPKAQEEANPQWFKASQEEDGEATNPAAGQETITWTASEFIAHAKSSGWYLALGIGAAVLAVVIFLITRDPVSVGVVIVSAVLLGMYAGHQPRQLEYRLDPTGLNIGEKRFTYDQFRSFSVVPEGAFASIVFMPLKRFAVPATIYFPPEDEDRIVNLLSSHLPLEERGHDAIDRLMQRIRF